MNPVTRYLVADYLNYRLSKHNLQWRGCPPLALDVINKVHLTMRNLADEFEKKYEEEFTDMVQQLHVTVDLAYETFLAVAEELFKEGIINWGRVVALFAFGGSLAVECMVKEMEHLVDSIYEWVSTYVQDKLSHWITDNGGWNGLSEFYDQAAEKKNEKNGWPSLGKWFVGAVGVLALGAIFTQKS
ncbi:hypothetical protein DPMN_063256 [Dreissena polymorpha]|uniref:Apoptosis regulator Bcl-2 family BH4 domain-containing protein n=2 Tax=Dreissena polymorpha TaxID=45954 RepID=A0A9D4CBC6_DREPO|nr:hypothetical protein DPMN_063256 [Dreissena polymorpha]